MTDTKAPERIWAVNFVEVQHDLDAAGKYWNSHVNCGKEFIRADLHDAAVKQRDELAAEVERLDKLVEDMMQELDSNAFQACEQHQRAEKAESELDRIRAFDGALHDRLAALVGDVDVDLDAPLSLEDEYETCSWCNGSGMVLDMTGEPDLCRECKGDTIVKLSECVIADTKAPERIWAGKYQVTFWQEQPHHQMTEYIRADTFAESYNDLLNNRDELAALCETLTIERDFLKNWQDHNATAVPRLIAQRDAALAALEQARIEGILHKDDRDSDE